MLTKLTYPFSGGIFRSPMPFSRFDRVGVWNAFQDEEVDLVVILTEPQEYLVYAGRDLPSFYRSRGIETLQITVPDFGIPEDLDLWNKGIAYTAEAAGNGRNVAVHCLAGVGRTGTFLACLAKEYMTMDADQAIQWVRDYVPSAMENWRQEEFVQEYQLHQNE